MKSTRWLFPALALWLAGGLQGAQAEVESWYTYWGFGFANNSYEEPLDSLVQAADGLPGVTRTQTAIDMLGFYWPMANEKTAVGFVISGSGDRLEDGWGNYVQINQYLYGASVMHFFGQEIGDGFFLRGDLGLSKAVVDASFGDPVSSDSGSGILFGVGYGIPVSGQSRVLISLTSGSNTIEGHSYQTTAVKIGGLW